jgi:hypothetical protein
MLSDKKFVAYLAACGVIIVTGIVIIIFLFSPTSLFTTVPESLETDLRETIELSSGNYIAGEDFIAGRYDIVAVSGKGTVSSSNMNINAMIGAEKDLNDLTAKYYETEYRNITLNEGITLKIDGVTVRLIPS